MPFYCWIKKEHIQTKLPSIPFPLLSPLCAKTHEKHYNFQVTKESNYHLTPGKSYRTYTLSCFSFLILPRKQTSHCWSKTLIRPAAVKSHGFIQLLMSTLVSIDSFTMIFGYTAIFIYNPHYYTSYPASVKNRVICFHHLNKSIKLHQMSPCWVWSSDSSNSNHGLR